MAQVETMDMGRVTDKFNPGEFGLPIEVGIIDRLDEDLLLCEVPINLIELEDDVPIGDDHVKELAEMMRGESQNRKFGGQLEPGLVVQVMDELADRPVLRIANGFHRFRIALENGVNGFYTTVRTRSNLEILYDLRIISAVSHKSVAFPRIIRWVGDAWNLTPMSKKLGVVKAFSLLAVPGLTGEKWGLSDEEMVDTTGWVKRKCDYWGRKPGGIYQQLLLAEKADPDLIEISRSGSKGNAPTPAQIRAVGFALPGTDNFGLQREVIDVAVQQGLDEGTTRKVADLVRVARSKGEVKKILSVNWKGVKEKHLPRKKKAEEPVRITESSTEIAALVNRAFQLEIENAELLAKLARIEERLDTDPTEVAGSKSTHRKKQEGVIQQAGSTKSSGRENKSYTADPDPGLVAKNLAAINAIQQAKNGDATFLYDLYEARMKSTLHGLLRYKGVQSEDDRDDIIQDMWVKVLRKIPDFEPKRDFEYPSLLNWLKITAVRLLIDRRRVRSATDELLDFNDEANADKIPDDFEPVEKQVLLNFSGYEIKRAVVGLNEKLQRQVVIMIFVLGLDTHDVAQILKSTEGAIRALKMRALDKLRQIISLQEALS